MNTSSSPVLGEVDQRRHERRRDDPLVLLRRHVGERRRQQRAAEAVAERVDLALAGRLLDRVERRERALLHVVVEVLVREALVGVDPRDHEHRVALVDRPLDERVLLAQVEDVELVDPRRDDQQRPLARPSSSSARTGSAASARSGTPPCPGVVAMLTPSSKAFGSVIEILSWPLPRSMSSSRLCRPLTRFSPPLVDRLAEHLGIGQREVRRRQRVDVLAGEEVDLLLGLAVEPLDARRPPRAASAR